MAASKILLKGGILLLHDDQDHVHWQKGDLLISGNTIDAIAEDIKVESDVEVIDCGGKLVSPGFIDTHQHVWQAASKGTHCDENMVQYFASGHFASDLLEPRDVYWGELSGCLQSIDAGTTTVVDYASINVSPDHSKQAIKATVASGIRSIFAYTPTPRVKQWTPVFELDPNLLQDFVMQTFHELAELAPFGPSGRVEFGFGFDGLWLPKDILTKVFGEVRAAGSKLITTHSMRCAQFAGSPGAAVVLDGYGLLGPDILLVHHNKSAEEDCVLLRRSGAHVASTPSTEIQMSQGDPVCFDPGMHEFSSIGVDLSTVSGGSIPLQMMLGLQYARGRRNADFEQHQKWPENINPTCEQAYNLGTILGARAIGKEHEIGSLAKGKKADIVIFSGDTPGMLSAVARNPVGAIVLNSLPRDVECVIVDGVFRKTNGQLQDIAEQVDDNLRPIENGCQIGWSDVVREIALSSKSIDKRRATKSNYQIAVDGSINAFYMNRQGMAESV